MKLIAEALCYLCSASGVAQIALTESRNVTHGRVLIGRAEWLRTFSRASEAVGKVATQPRRKKIAEPLEDIGGYVCCIGARTCR